MYTLPDSCVSQFQKSYNLYKSYMSNTLYVAHVDAWNFSVGDHGMLFYECYECILFIHRWLDDNEEDGKIVRELRLQTQRPDILDKQLVSTFIIINSYALCKVLCVLLCENLTVCYYSQKYPLLFITGVWITYCKLRLPVVHVGRILYKYWVIASEQSLIGTKGLFFEKFTHLSKAVTPEQFKLHSPYLDILCTMVGARTLFIMGDDDFHHQAHNIDLQGHNTLLVR